MTGDTTARTCLGAREALNVRYVVLYGDVDEWKSSKV